MLTCVKVFLKNERKKLILLVFNFSPGMSEEEKTEIHTNSVVPKSENNVGFVAESTSSRTTEEKENSVKEMKTEEEEVGLRVERAINGVKTEPEEFSFSLSTNNLKSLKEAADFAPSTTEIVSNEEDKTETPKKIKEEVKKTDHRKTEEKSGKDRKSDSDRERRRKHDRDHRNHRERVKKSNVRLQTRLEERSSKRRNAGYSMANPCPSLGHMLKYKYGQLFNVETYPNGGGKVLHLWQDDIKHLSEEEVEQVAREFLEVSLNEQLELQTHKIFSGRVNILFQTAKYFLAYIFMNRVVVKK